MSEAKTVEWVNGRVRMIDQTRIPEKLVYVTFKDYREVAKAIKRMVVRGAPAIGVAAAMAMALAANSNERKSKGQFIKDLQAAGKVLCMSRPTARNLSWAVERILRKAEATGGGVQNTVREIVEEAQKIAQEDVDASRMIGEFGSSLIKDKDTVLTHCNTGTFATVNYGTALAPIRTAFKQGKSVRVIATETRPRLQGAKLTTFELLSDKIPVTLIVDGAAGYVMKRGMVQAAIVGADRITREVVANKVGTYLVALAAHANKLPFYVAAPSSTLDLKKTAVVEVEERDAREVTHIAGKRIPPRGVEVFNPAFDITPIELVTGFITENGILRPEDLGDGA
jgi:methylthioribose-1-phosphate isomerase